MTTKIEALVDGVGKRFSYGDAFVREMAATTPRIRIGLDARFVGWLVRLASVLRGPYQLLYVLHTTRTGSPLGRYQSPSIDFDDLKRFLEDFGDFIAGDSRHDLWVHTESDDATIVFDRHNLMFAYGPLDTFEHVLLDGGVRPSIPNQLPDPHVHHYHSVWDGSERRILTALDWSYTPLREQDIQYIESRN